MTADFWIREATLDDAPAIARVHVATWQTTYTGLFPAEFMASMTVERRTERWQNSISTSREGGIRIFVAEDANGIFGFVAGGPERDNDPVYKGELYAIYLLKTAEGRGAGRALLLRMAQFLREQGYLNMLLWVLKDNPRARGFYEAMGGQYVREKTVEFGGEPIIEVGYGWPDLAALLSEKHSG
jgi:ribosomal protein S18 acetylase RimI-like enzyme